ncbi:MAG: hypothetical protein HY000_29910 [Planctomycetes bacterium]|nr:hypothetical protein [Planctomycetota bacterium]
MRIIRRLPFYPHGTTVESPTGPVSVVPYQIIVWVGIRVRGTFSRFPAILDTGNSHNLSIGEKQLTDWTGAKDLRTVGEVVMNGRLLQAKRVELGLFRNVPSTRDPVGNPYDLSIPQGIIVFPDEAPRLPLLGIRALVRCGLKTVIDGKRMQVSISRGFWK